jgi:RNA polymerase sigma-70 factor, ECF subfamily
MQTAVDTFLAAVDAADPSRARRVLSDADADERTDLVEVLAQRAAADASPLAVELLIEAVDRFGLARSAVRLFLLDEAAVDDVTQDTLISVARTVTGFRGEAKFTTWLHQIARYRAVDHLRRVRSAPSLPEDDNEPTPTAWVSSLVASRQTVRALLEGLAAPYRDAVVLRDVEQLPYAEIAERLDLNLNTVKSHVARGRALLAALVERSDAA